MRPKASHIVERPNMEALVTGSSAPELAAYLRAHRGRQNGKADIDKTESLATALEQAIEELRLAEDELFVVRSQAETDRARYHDLFEFAPDGYMVTDAHGKILEANVAAHAMFKCRPGQGIVGKPLLICVDPRDRATYFRVLSTMRQQSRGDWKLHFVSRDKVPMVVETTVGAIRDGIDNLLGFRWIIRDITEQTALHQEVQKHRDQLRALAAQLATAEERERKRIAVGVHDRISQTLAAGKLLLGQVRQSVTDPDGRQALQELKTLLDTAMEESRSLTFELSPPMLHQLGLAAALQWLGEQITRRHGINVKIEDHLPAPLLGPEEVTALLFQSVRELLNNTVKHASATEVVVSIAQRQNCACIAVRDDGAGFAVNERATGPAHSQSGFGLFSIRTRIEQIGGHFNIRSSVNSGTSIMLVVPLTKTENKSCTPES